MKNTEYFILSILIYMHQISGGLNKFIPTKILDRIGKGNEPTSCPSVQFLINSSFTDFCDNKIFPIQEINPNEIEPETLLCLGLYDLSAKWCLKSSQNYNLPVFKNTLEFERQVTNFESLSNIHTFCESPKNVTDTKLEKMLKVFYMNSMECIADCLDISAENHKPRKICSVISWMYHMIESNNDITKHFQDTSVKSTGTVVDNKTVADKNKGVNIQQNMIKEVEQIKMENVSVIEKISESDEILDRGRTTKSYKETALTTRNKEPNSLDKKVIVTENDSTAIAVNVQNGKIPEDTKNSLLQKKIDPAMNHNNQNQQSIIDNKFEIPVKSNSLPSILESGKAFENAADSTSLKKPPAADVPDTNKKTISDFENKMKKPDTEDIKLDTISENTYNFNPNADGNHEDNLAFESSEKEPNGDHGLPNENQLYPVQNEVFPHYHSKQIDDESHFFTYLVVFSLLLVCGYIGYHNKQKVLAILLEGRRSRGGRGRRRPSTASYRKLDSNLEEAVTSQCHSSVTNVIY